jgi:hypothetical protein
MNFGELGAPDPLLINRPGGQAAGGMHHFGGNVAATSGNMGGVLLKLFYY